MLGLKKIQTSLSEETYLLLLMQNHESRITNKLVFFGELFIVSIAPLCLLFYLILP